MTGYTRLTKTLTWEAPENTGGCFITSYHIYRDDGNGGAFSLVDDSSVANLPAKREHTMTFLSSETGKTFKYYMTAVSSVGFVQSSTISYVLAAVPDKPSTVPKLNLA
jgi:hypothetical protein